MSRREEIRKIHKNQKFFYEMLGGAVVLVICVLIGTGAFGGDNIDDYRMNLFTEGMGIVATVFMINRWYAHREQESLKERLIREAGSRSNDIAISAVEWMRREGWLCGDDGLLKGAELKIANLQRANLHGANLIDTNLQGAMLQETDLSFARIQYATLYKAQLCKAEMAFAKMQGADFFAANLQGAMLYAADLRDARFDGADLTGASLMNAKLEHTVFRGEDVPDEIRSLDSNFKNLPATMPDGTKFELGFDMERFTDMYHREYNSTLVKINQIRKLLGLKALQGSYLGKRRATETPVWS